MAEEVMVLKRFRDNVLLSSSVGRSFVEFYYEVSPPMADFISNHDTLRAIVRWSLLPLVAMSWTALLIGPVATLALMVLFTTLLVIRCAMLFKPRIKGQSRKDLSSNHEGHEEHEGSHRELREESVSRR